VSDVSLSDRTALAGIPAVCFSAGDRGTFRRRRSGCSLKVAVDCSQHNLHLPEMDFSELFKHSGSAGLRWSPNGKYLATTVGFRVVIRSADTLEVLQLWTCQDAINSVEWSPDSKYILCAMYKRAAVQVLVFC